MTSQSDQQYDVRDKSSTRLGNCTSCNSKLNLNSLPFNNLNDDFDNAISIKFNLQDNLLTKLQKLKFTLFLQTKKMISMHNNTDPDNNNLLRQSKEDNCQYYTEERFNNLI